MNHISYSAIRTFCNCRKAFKFRYLDRIESIKRADYFSFGSVIHSCLEAYYNGKRYKEIIDVNYPDTIIDKKQEYSEALASAMMKGYVKKYDDDLMNFKVIGTEIDFELPIINPLTKRRSRKYNLHGKIDMVIKKDGGLWIVEHKTASQVYAGYIDRLWHDLQIAIYLVKYEELTGLKIDGIIYNVIKKAQIKLKKTETIDEFKERLSEKYMTDPDMFFRTEIFIDEERKLEVKRELWNIAKAMNTDNIFKNRSQCYIFGECEYFKICNSNDNPMVIQNYYKERENATTNGKEQEDNKSF